MDLKIIKDDYVKDVKFSETSNSKKGSREKAFKVSNSDRGLDVWHRNVSHLASSAINDTIRNHATRAA